MKWSVKVNERTFLCASLDALPLRGIKVTSSIMEVRFFCKFKQKNGITHQIVYEYKFTSHSLI